MYLGFKKLIFAIIFNTCVFLSLIVGIQNSSNKSKVNLIFDETVNLPISFIVGTSFLVGSILGILTSLSSNKKKNIN